MSISHLQSTFAISEHVCEHRSILCKIVISEDDTETKLRRLRGSILKYRSQRLKLIPEKEEAVPEKEEVKRTLDQFYQDMTSNISLIERVTEEMQTMALPVMKHDQLLDSIAEVIRSEASSQEKIDLIFNILM